MRSEVSQPAEAGISLWPRRVLGPPPGVKELTVACWTWFVWEVIMQCIVPAWSRLKSGAELIHLFPCDFIYFYGIGRIANEYPLTKLYDYGVQLKIFNNIYLLQPNEGFYGPSPYPPYVALFFGLFARLPFLPAFLLWQGVSLVLYITGIAAAAKGLFPGTRSAISLTFSLALAFCPFLHNTLASGQIATIAVFSLGLTTLLERRSKPFASGLALSILAYKPTLVLLVIPMLLLTRRLRTLGGFIAGGTLLATAATAFGGMQMWVAYLRFLSFFGKFAGVNGRSVLFARQYVDVKSFVQAACGGWSGIELVIIGALAILILACLSVLLWKSASAGEPAQLLVWSSILTWTLLLNVYVPAYDSILAVPAFVLALGALRELEWKAALRWMTLLAVVISVGSWELEKIAQTNGIQFLSLFFATMGFAQLYLLRRAIGQRPRQGADEALVGEVATIS